MTICWKSQTCFQWWVHFHLFKRKFAREKLIPQALALFAKAHLHCKPLKMIYNHPACFYSSCENIPKDRKGQLFSIFLFVCLSCKKCSKMPRPRLPLREPLKRLMPCQQPPPWWNSRHQKILYGSTSWQFYYYTFGWDIGGVKSETSGIHIPIPPKSHQLKYWEV